MKKINRKDIPPIEKENERDENYKGSNKNIDHSRTGNNIHFIERGQSYISYINQRIKELGCRTKKDTVLISSMLVSASPEWFKGKSPEQIREYFRECYYFFAERYGEENIVGAVVHLDETTPHMHLNLLPVLNGRFCCKELFNRNGLIKLQTDIYEEVGKHWGLKRGREGSKTKHLDVAEYKVRKAEEKAAEITAAYTEAEQDLAKTKAEKRQTETELESLSSQREMLSREIDGLTKVKDAAISPVPLVGKAPVITALRIENTKLKQQLAEKDREIVRVHEDQASTFAQLKQAERIAKVYEQEHSEIADMKAIFPKEYEELLKRARHIKAILPHKTVSHFNAK